VFYLPQRVSAQATSVCKSGGRIGNEKRAGIDWSRHFAGGRLTGNWSTCSLLGKKSRLSGRIRGVEKIAQAHANEAKPLLRVETDAFAQ
jgi:hypothetical protein